MNVFMGALICLFWFMSCFDPQRHYSPFGHVGWVGGVPPWLPPGQQIDSPESPAREGLSDEVRNSPNK